MGVLSKLFGRGEPSFPPNPFQTLPLGNGKTIRCKIHHVIWGREIAINGTISDEIAYYMAITPEGKYFRLTSEQVDSMIEDVDISGKRAA